MKIITKSINQVLLYFVLVLLYNLPSKAGIVPGCIKANYTKLDIRPLCGIELKVEGLDEESIEWIIDGQSEDFTEDYLSCTKECASVFLNPPDNTLANFVILVSGTPLSSCTNNIGPTPVSVTLKIEVNVVTANPLTASITPSPAVTCSSKTINITANPSGGVGPYTYLWNNSLAETTQSISVGAGNYQVTVRDTFSRCAPVLVSTNVSTNPTPAAPTAPSPIEYCVGNTATTLTATGSNLLWYTSELGVGSAMAPLPSTASAGTTSYWVSQTVGGCESPKTKIEVVVTAIPNFTVTANSASTCGGTGSIVLGNLQPSTSYNLSYQFNLGTPVGATFTTNSMGTFPITNLSIGSYSSISVNKLGCGVINSTTYVIGSPSAPNPTISANNSTSCSPANGSLAFTNLSPSTSFSISYVLNGGTPIIGSYTSSASGGVTISGLGAGTYTSVGVTNSSTNCTFNSSAIYTITGVSAPSFTLSSTNPINCNNTTGTISIGGLQASTSYAISYTYNGNPVAAANYTTNSSGVYTFTGLGAGTYTSITVALGTCSTTSAQSITLVTPSTPTISTSNAAMCADGVSTKTLAASASGTWSLAPASTASIGTISGTTFTVGTVSGSAVILFTANNGCTATLSFIANALPSINVSASNATTCGGLGLVNIAISNPAGNYDVDLDGNGNYEYSSLGTSGGNISIGNLVVGTVVNGTRIRAVTTGCVSLPFNINTTISQPANPSNTTSTTAMCADGTSTRALTGTPVGGTWALASGSTASIGAVSGSTFTVGSVSGSAIISYTVSGCSTNITIPVSSIPTVVINNPAAVCSPATVNLTATAVTNGSTSGLTYTYFTNASGTNVLATPSAVASLGTYYIKGTNASGCSDIKPVVVTINSAVTANAGSNQSVCSTSVSLNGTATSGASVSWSASVAGTFNPNNTSLSTVFTPSATPTSAITLTLNASIGSCIATASSINVNFQTRPTVLAGQDQSLCSNVNTINLIGNVTPNNTPVQWQSNGTGSFLNSSSTSTSASYSPSSADKTNGLRFVLSSTNPSCNNSDTVFVNFSPTPTLSAGNARTVCTADKSVLMSPTVSPSNTPVLWTSSGTGTWVNANIANARYLFSAQDSANGSVTLTITSQNSGNCNTSSNVVITINPTPFVSVLPNYISCSFATSIALVRGTVNPANTPIQWTVSGGTGTFGNSTSLNTTYNPSAADKQNTTNPIYLIATTTSPGCIGVDTAVYRIQPAAIPNAGINRTVCANLNSVVINGSVSPSNANVSWTTSGSGTFVNNSIVAPTYIPSASDKAAGSVTLTMSTLGFGDCNTSSSMNLSFTQPPNIDAGPSEVNVCRTTNSLSVLGTRSPTNTPIRWSTTGTGEFDSETSINTQYDFSAADRINNSLYLILRSTNASCNSRDSIKINFVNRATVNAGSNATRCTNNPNLQLNGTVQGITTSGVWTSNGSGQFITSPNLLTAMYVPSESDKATGSTGVRLTLTSTNNGNCPASSESITLSFVNSPTVLVGSDRTVCANTKSLLLNGSVTGSTTTGVWSSSGNGSFSNNTSMTPTYTFGSQDSTNGSVNITLTSTNNGGCLATSSSFVLNITSSPKVDAGVNQTICDNISIVTLNGSVTGATTTGIWSTNGSGTFGSNTSLQTTYTPSNADKQNGVSLRLTSTNNGGCNAVADLLNLSFSASPSVNAGNDFTVCANASSINLNGQVSGITSTGSWRSLSTNPGTFTNLNSTSTSYTPSTSEKSSGSVTLVLSSTNNGNCNPSSDQVSITFSPVPVVSAGNNQSVCANIASVNLLGTLSGATTTGLWTTNGTGKFSPSATALDAQYQFSEADRQRSTINVTLTSTNNGSCNEVSDTKTITLTPAPTADAGSNISVCANNSNIGLDGKITIASGGIWSTNGTGRFSPDNTTLRASYIPGELEKASGSATITLTTTGNGNCNPSTSSMTLRITQAPISDAGEDKVICKNDPNVQLNGKVTTRLGDPNGTGTWRTTGTGTFSNTNSLTSTYTPSQADITNGVNLVLLSTNNANCLPAIDTLNVRFSDVPVNAGTDLTTCVNNPPVQLGGTISGANSAGLWTTSGTGTFSPSNQYSSATGAERISYVPSQADKQSKTPIRLTLTATSSNANCVGSMSSSILLSIIPSPSVSVEEDKTVCSSLEQIPISGTLSGATGAVWSTVRGTGSFSPSNSSLSTNYVPSANDIENGSVRLRLTSVGNGPCIAANQVLVVNIEKAPILSAGVNTTVCSNIDSVALNGVVSNYNGLLNWTTSGTGTFLPNANQLKAYYKPSVADLASGKVSLTFATEATNICGSVSDKFDLSFTKVPSISAGKDTTICNNSTELRLSATVSDLTPVLWATNGKGSFSSSTVLNPVYTFNQSDFEESFITFTASTNSASTGCPASRSTIRVSFSPKPLVNAGADTSVCENNGIVSLKGLVSIADGGTWSSSGKGIFGNKDLLNTTYTPSIEDYLAGSVNITLTSTGNKNCLPVSESLILSFKKSASLNAGIDFNVCQGDTVVNLSGTVLGSANPSVLWKTLGTGSFLGEATQLNTTYKPSLTDAESKSISFVLTYTNTGECSVLNDTVKANFTQLASVNAGNDITICANQPIQLNGTLSEGATKVRWSSNGSGTFVPTANQLSVVYQPTINDLTLGTLDITLTATDACAPVSDKLVLTLISSPLVEAGSNQEICEGNNAVNVNGFITEGGTIKNWVSTGDGSFENTSSLETIYNLGENDKQNKEVKLVLVAEQSGNCPGGTDTLTVLVLNKPIVEAGNDRVACSNGLVDLEGTITGGSGRIVWSSNGAGQFLPSDTLLNASYKPSPIDVQAGKVKLMLSSINNSGCPNSIDSLELVISKSVAELLNAGSDKNICAGSIAQLGSTASEGYSYLWSPSVGISDSTSANPTVRIQQSPTKDTVYTYVVTFTDQISKCVSKDTVLVSLSPKPKPTAIENSFVLCGEARNNLEYSVIGLPNSKYSWKISNGTIVSGLTNNTVVVNWDSGFDQSLSVIEESDKGCTSDEVVIKLNIDNAGIVIKNVTNAPALNNSLVINWSFASLSNIPKAITLFRRKVFPNIESFIPVKSFEGADSSYTDIGIDTGAVYEYKFRFSNSCENIIETPIHNNILMRFSAIDDAKAQLNWNRYIGWKSGVDSYEVWRKTDGGYEAIATLDSSVFTYVLNDIKYPSQCYYIKALPKKEGLASYSNEYCETLQFDFVIPNAFSPNGDNVNELWVIKNIEFFKNNEVRVFNQWNSEVYSKKNYNNLEAWDGGDLPDGTYYYQIKTKNKTYSGFLLIVR